MQVKTAETKPVKIPGKLPDDGAEDFFTEIEKYCRNNRAPLVLDCSELQNVASSHIGVLWHTKDICDRADVKVSLAGVSRNLVRVLEVLDIADLFEMEIVEREEEAGEFTRTFQLAPDKNFEMTFRATDKDIDEALDSFLDYMRNFCDSDMYLFEVRTIFYEIATNIRQHGVAGNGGEVKFMVVPKQNDKFIMRFIDDGPPFNPASQMLLFNPETAMKKKQKRGFGLIMINRMTDGITYERRNGEYNVLTLEKKWK